VRQRLSSHCGISLDQDGNNHVPLEDEVFLDQVGKNHDSLYQGGNNHLIPFGDEVSLDQDGSNRLIPSDDEVSLVQGDNEVSLDQGGNGDILLKNLT
jgi:hypothetical protein